MIQPSLFLRYLLRLLPLIGVLFLPETGQSQVCNKVEVKEVFEAIYSYQLLKADSLAKEGIRKHPESAEWSLLKATVIWWQVISGNLENEAINEEFTDYLAKAKKQLANADEASRDDAFNTILVYAMHTRFDLLHNNYLTAIGHLNASIDRISDSFEKEEDYPPFYLTSGLYYFFMQEAYEEYPIMRPALFFYPDGDKEKGLTHLLNMRNSDDLFLRTEANYFLMRIYLEVDEDYNKALYAAQMLVNEHPDNLIFRFYLIRVYWMGARFEEAEAQKVIYKNEVKKNKQLDDAQRLFFIDMLDEKEG